VRILGIDFGLARIGLALSDPTGTVASPLTVLHEKDKGQQIARVVELAREHEVEAFVVGIPYELDGSQGEMAQTAERYAKKLAQVTGLPVARLDERFTSREAERAIQATGRGGPRGRGGQGRSRKKKRLGVKDHVDKVAASLILQAYLDAGAPPPPAAGEGEG